MMQTAANPQRRIFCQHAMSAMAKTTVGLGVGTALSACSGVGVSSFSSASRPSTLTAIASKTRFDAELNATIPMSCELKAIAKSEQPIGQQGYRWHDAPDGGACFEQADGSWIYVSNSEVKYGKGGAGAIRFTADGSVQDAYPILKGTNHNCSGGKTPWNTWVSCEENGDNSWAFECDPTGRRKAVKLESLGAFNHEAVAVDPATGWLYMTEDHIDGGLYRFRPNQYGDLSSGVLEVAIGQAESLSWVEVPDHTAKYQPVRMQIAETRRFKGGEGIVFRDGKVLFSTKLDNRIWSYDVNSHALGIVYQPVDEMFPLLSGVDALGVSPSGDILVAEDGGNMQVIILDKNGKPTPVVTLHGQEASEVTGLAFSPDGRHLLFSSQRGPSGKNNDGITYQLTFPIPVQMA